MYAIAIGYSVRIQDYEWVLHPNGCLMKRSTDLFTGPPPSCHAGAPEESAAPAPGSITGYYGYYCYSCTCYHRTVLALGLSVRCENRRALRAEPHSLCTTHTAIHTIAAHRVPLRASCDFYSCTIQCPRAALA